MLFRSATAASGSTVVVDDDGAGNFTKIQDAINSSEIGDVIVVHNGTYPENFIVDRSIVLKGENGPVVEGSGLPDPLTTITSENVTLDGFSFTGCLNDSFNSGAVLVLADGCKILNCSISASSGNGLKLIDSKDHLISGNQICDNRYGGISFTRANSSKATENQILRNGKWGVVLESCARDDLIQNVFRENREVGIQLTCAELINVVWNSIDQNQEDEIGRASCRERV